MVAMGYLDTPAAVKMDGTKPGAAGNAPGDGADRRFNTEDISNQLLRSLQPLHVDSLSLHDGAGELLWLNEGAFGPDEHGVVLDALDVFALDSDRGDLHLKLDDDRTALFACARDASAEVRGIALAIVETPASEEFAAKLSAPRLAQLMRRFAQLLAPPPRSAVASAKPTPAASPAKSQPAPVTFSSDAEITAEVAVQPERRTMRSSSAEKTPAPHGGSGTIHARRYARLRAGGAARRYEVKLAPDASFSADLTLATRVIEHLQRSGDRYTQTPASFGVPLSLQSITQPGWLSKLESILARADLPENLIGFCLPPAAWEGEFEATELFVAECEQLRCFVALDDFTLGSSGLNLLRSSAVKCLKLDPKLIGSVVNDKFSHATMAAIVQAARVLGLYCVAKQVSSSSEAKWLAAAGIEFADGVSRGVAVAATTKTGEVLTLQAGD
jgi:EAL domain-containing protein (putative c-di-GMP-specific phosphodiesterase class I)